MQKDPPGSRIATYLYLDSSGIFGLPLDLAAGIVVAFIFFGQALYAVGGETFLTDIALVLMGRYPAVRPRSRWGRRRFSVRFPEVRWLTSLSMAYHHPDDEKERLSPTHRCRHRSGGYNSGQIMPPVMGVAAFLMA